MKGALVLLAVLAVAYAVSVEDSGQYVADTSGDYVPDKWDKIEPHVSQVSVKAPLPPVLRPKRSVEDSGQYVADTSGDYVPDKWDKVEPHVSQVSLKAPPPPALRPKRQSDCAPNGTPCDYQGRGGFTNCCTKYCHQLPEEQMGRCADHLG